VNVKELIKKLEEAPPEAEVLVDRGGAYNNARSVDIYPPTSTYPTGAVFISDEKEEG
jgi:hypothetical protein